MTLSEVLRAANASGDWRHLVDQYWDLETYLSYVLGIPFSSLDMADPEYRTCPICGTVSRTSNSGGYPDECSNAQCQEIRSFWGIGNGWSISSLGFKSNTNRGTYLRNRIRSTFGERERKHDAWLIKVPESLRFVYLLSIMVERIAHEYHR